MKHFAHNGIACIKKAQSAVSTKNNGMRTSEMKNSWRLNKKRHCTCINVKVKSTKV
jgi:hypothetical protein